MTTGFPLICRVEGRILLAHDASKYVRDRHVASLLAMTSAGAILMGWLFAKNLSVKDKILHCVQDNK
jgi:hypothetical protein